MPYFVLRLRKGKVKTSLSQLLYACIIELATIAVVRSSAQTQARAPRVYFLLVGKISLGRKEDLVLFHW